VTRRLLLSYLTITVIVLVLLELPLAIFYQQREADRLTAKVERDATVMATIYEDILQENLAPDPIPAARYAQETGARVVVVDIDGISIVDSAREADRDFSTRPEIDKALTGVRATGIRRSDTLDTELLYVAVPVASGGTVHGAVRITFGTHEMNERVQRFWLGLIAVAAVVLVVTAAVGWVLARSVTKPVRRLQVAAQRFSRGDLTPIDTGSNSAPELAALETGLNDMAQQLDDLIERQRTFVADASHQLRTPLTALRLRLENLHSEAPTASLSNELDKAIDETTRLSTLVNDLLQLARTEQYREDRGRSRRHLDRHRRPKRRSPRTACRSGSALGTGHRWRNRASTRQPHRQRPACHTRRHHRDHHTVEYHIVGYHTVESAHPHHRHCRRGARADRRRQSTRPQAVLEIRCLDRRHRARTGNRTGDRQLLGWRIPTHRQHTHRPHRIDRARRRTATARAGSSAQFGVSCSEPSDRHTVGRAAHVSEAHLAA
jgi:HAMP domain-containing protein